MQLENLLSEIKEELVKIRKDLDYHIKRTDLLEEDFKPVKKHVDFVNSLAKAFSTVVLLGAAMSAIARFFLR